MESEFQTVVLHGGVAVGLRGEANQICNLVLSVGLQVGVDYISFDCEGGWLLPLVGMCVVAVLIWHSGIDPVAVGWLHGNDLNGASE